MVFPVLLLTLGAAAVLFGSRRHRTRRPHAAMPGSTSASPVAFQHLQLFQGGMLSQASLDAAKVELQNKLRQGGMAAAETCLRPGLEYVVNVRALTEIGTDDCGRILERQVSRKISDDPVEQSWYWIDLAGALRELNRSESLPLLLRCSERALEGPLGHLFAAEMTAFPQFSEYLGEPVSAQGRMALRVLRTAMEGIRRGYVPVTLYAEAQIGELIRRLTEMCPDHADPLLARVFLESLRHARRSYAASPELRDDAMRRQAVRWQASQLRDVEPVLREYLHDIGNDLSHMLPRCSPREQAEILEAIDELHADAGDILAGMLIEPNLQCRDAAIRCLQWSSSNEAACLLWNRARQVLSGKSARSSWLKLKRTSRDASTSELLAIVRALRGHPGEESEAVLRMLATQQQPQIRIAALQSLGWWEPIQRAEIINILHLARIDGKAEVRSAAIAALARLGECAALQVLRDSMTHANAQMVHQTIEVIANEGLTWLWPELDLLTEADDPAIAHHAWEAIEWLRESILGPLA